MIVDTSAVIAILKQEPDAGALSEALERADEIRMSAGTYVELGVVVDSVRDPIASRKLDLFLNEAEVRIEPVTELQAKVARQAYRDFGKGSGHPAQLNFGDCFSYALAAVSGEALLFKGDDFSRTDVKTTGNPPSR